MKDKIVVFGGSGFFGRALVQVAAEKGYRVVSISRSGQPFDSVPHPNISWEKGDVFIPETWEHHLLETTVVVNCIGIIQQKKSKDVTYQKFNMEAATILAKNAFEQQVPFFVYLSAKQSLPFILRDYFESKRKAEAAVQLFYPKALIIRPSLLVGKVRKGTHTIQSLMTILHKIHLFQAFQPERVEEAAQEVLNQIESMIQKK